MMHGHTFVLKVFFAEVQDTGLGLFLPRGS